MRNTTSKATSATPQRRRTRANWLTCLCAVSLLLNTQRAQAEVIAVRYSVTTSSGTRSSLPKPAPLTAAPSLPKPSVISAPSLPKPISGSSGPSLPKPQPQPKDPFLPQDSSEKPSSSLPKPGPAVETPSLPKPTGANTPSSLPKPTNETAALPKPTPSDNEPSLPKPEITDEQTLLPKPEPSDNEPSLPKPETTDEQSSLPKPTPSDNEPSLPKPETTDEQSSLPKPTPSDNESSLPKPETTDEQTSLPETEPVGEDSSGADQQSPVADEREDLLEEDDTTVSPIDLVTPVTDVSPLNPPESGVPDYDDGFEITYSPGSGSSQYPQFNFDPDDSDYDEGSSESYYGIDHSPGDDFLYSDLYDLDDISDEEYPMASWGDGASAYGATIPEPGTVIPLAITMATAALTGMWLRRRSIRRVSIVG